MTYQTETKGAFYLMSVLSFDVGTPVTLYGAVQVTTENEFYFVLSKDLTIDPNLLPAGVPTETIDAPFGMRGVRLEDFNVRARIYKDQNATKSDILLNATASFPALSGFTLSGAIVFENGSPRLALVSLSADQPLTITDFVNKMIGGFWMWSGITDQFAFQSGDMYYLNPPANAPDDYKYVYKANGQELTCLPGYGLDATLQIFQRYDFHITLRVDLPARGINGPGAIELQGTFPTIDFDLVKLDKLTLAISTKQGYLRIGGDVTILGTDIGNLEADYDSTNDVFGGEISGGSLLPPPITSIAFRWTKDDGVKIISIGGLPQQLVDFIQFVKALNSMGGGCQSIVDQWFNNLDLKATLNVALNGSPSKGSLTMSIPLKLHYEVSAGGQSLDSGNVPFLAGFPLPGSLKEVPEAIGKSIVNNLVSIAGSILANPSTYKAVAEYIAVTVGKKAFARMLCRAIELDPQTAEDLSESADEAISDDLEGSVELAAQLTRVALLNLPGIVSGLGSVLAAIADLAEQIWKGIGNLLHLKQEKSEKEDERDDLENKIRAQCQKVQDVLDNLYSQVASYTASIQIKQVDLRLEAGNVYVVTWTPAARDLPGLNSPVACAVRLLDNDGITLWSLPDGSSVYADQSPYRIEMGANRAPVLYASVASSVPNLKLMDDDTSNKINDSITQLDNVDDDVATQWAKQLRESLKKIPSTITTNPVLSATKLGMIVGNSFIGKNTIILRN